MVSDGVDGVSFGRVFQTRRPANVKTLLPAVENLRVVPAGY